MGSFKPSKVRWELAYLRQELEGWAEVLSPQRYVGNPGGNLCLHVLGLAVLSPQRYVGNGFPPGDLTGGC